MSESLTKTKSDGTLYTRRPEIEDWLIKLENVTVNERIAKLSISQRQNPDYISSEVLLYFLRQASKNKTNKNKEYEFLFKSLMYRVEQTLRSRINDSLINNADLIREDVKGQLIQLLVDDYTNHSSGLDYYEVSFDHALAALRISTIRKEKSQEIKNVPLEIDGSNELMPEIESAIADFFESNQSQLDDPTFRSALYAAIDNLSNDEKQVVCLILEGYQIYSKNSELQTISSILECDERTVRNRRSRAYIALRNHLQEEWA